MREQATVDCTTCHRTFAAAMPLDRAALARSGLMFMVETCPHCSASQSYYKSQYHFSRTVAAR